ncbi:hypothetical protein GQ457_18G008870 [Hibiscus cannabinus]
MALKITGRSILLQLFSASPGTQGRMLANVWPSTMFSAVILMSNPSNDSLNKTSSLSRSLSWMASCTLCSALKIPSNVKVSLMWG